MDVSKLVPTERIGIPHGVRRDIWWHGFNMDVWLKTSMLTFNRVFPHEINRFTPLLSGVDEVAKHLRFAAMVNLEQQFSEAYIAGLAPEKRLRGTQILSAAADHPC